MKRFYSLALLLLAGSAQAQSLSGGTPSTDRLTVPQNASQKAVCHGSQKETAEGVPFTDFKGEGLDGSELHLSDFVGRGKYVLADMWASWCGPCKSEIPYLAELYNTYKDKGLVVLGIATWDSPENIKKAVTGLNITWPQLIDTGNAATEKYGVKGIPHIILFAPDGTIVARKLRGEVMKARVKEVMENMK